uniref:Uncharacterized protein n=1 Tax=Myotis myotis TaxID=51298 RepID=A0A7J7ZX95_MYOMY|nr:hypothetical protein mMyoMyo1_009595 [Myotis myotis]
MYEAHCAAHSEWTARTLCGLQLSDAVLWSQWQRVSPGRRKAGPRPQVRRLAGGEGTGWLWPQVRAWQVGRGQAGLWPQVRAWQVGRGQAGLWPQVRAWQAGMGGVGSQPGEHHPGASRLQGPAEIFPQLLRSREVMTLAAQLCTWPTSGQARRPCWALPACWLGGSLGALPETGHAPERSLDQSSCPAGQWSSRRSQQ